MQPHEIQSFVNVGRDVLGFIIHDLIHADHFIADTAKAQAQIEFSKKNSTSEGINSNPKYTE